MSFNRSNQWTSPPDAVISSDGHICPTFGRLNDQFKDLYLSSDMIASKIATASRPQGLHCAQTAQTHEAPDSAQSAPTANTFSASCPSHRRNIGAASQSRHTNYETAPDWETELLPSSDSQWFGVSSNTELAAPAIAALSQPQAVDVRGSSHPHANPTMNMVSSEAYSSFTTSADRLSDRHYRSNFPSLSLNPGWSLANGQNMQHPASASPTSPAHSDTTPGRAPRTATSRPMDMSATHSQSARPLHTMQRTSSLVHHPLVQGPPPYRPDSAPVSIPTQHLHPEPDIAQYGPATFTQGSIDHLNLSTRNPRSACGVQTSNTQTSPLHSPLSPFGDHSADEGVFLSTLPQLQVTSPMKMPQGPGPASYQLDDSPSLTHWQDAPFTSSLGNDHHHDPASSASSLSQTHSHPDSLDNTPRSMADASLSSFLVGKEELVYGPDSPDGTVRYYPCAWGEPCGTWIRGDRTGMTRHLRSRHGVAAGDKEEQRCLWTGCSASMKMESVGRHIVSIHLGISLSCLNCHCPFSREDAWRRHVQSGRCRRAGKEVVDGPNVRVVDTCPPFSSENGPAQKRMRVE
ncbi:hypothetical protein BV22DRAFT_1128043 [Leucogyrophana mollusca]|uniref:Uncharacterized protein n=1 Tax=Leucogyrophana mollusca TaxID=85980 RepID=A0ACB8BMT6_9AGAM|nr:hypothetical protein BV22DRAFT_1128043 [Leucogyrophana mollusca]